MLNGYYKTKRIDYRMKYYKENQLKNVFSFYSFNVSNSSLHIVSKII